MNTHYYLEARTHTVCKNNLHKELAPRLLALNGIIIEHEHFLTFIGKIRKLVEAYNEKHKRCKPIELHVWGDKGTLHIHGFDPVVMKLLPGTPWNMMENFEGLFKIEENGSKKI